MSNRAWGSENRRGDFKIRYKGGGPMDSSGVCPNQMDLLHLSRKKFREQLRLAEIIRGLRSGPGPVLTKPCSHPGI